MRLNGGRRGLLAASIAVALGAGAPSPAAAQAPAAQRLRLPLPAYDGTLTPYTFALGYPLVTLVYDTLLWRDVNGVPQPWLARSVSRSPDGRRLTIKLRDGVRWHDGRPLTAADVAFTFGFVASRYQARFTPQLADVARVRAAGPLTVEIDLRRPSLGFDDQPLADLPILPRHLWRGLAPGRTAPPGPAVGSGPYRLVSARPGAGYVLRANSGYFLGTPPVGELRVPIIGDLQRTYRALRSRRVDMIPLSLPGSAASDLGADLGIALRKGPSYSGTALVFNVRRAPFDDPAVRRAVAGALDLRRIARNVDPVVPADEGFVHPESRWAAGTRLQRTDPAAARRVLAALGGQTLRVLAPINDPTRREAGRQVVLALRRAGARAQLVELSRARLERATGADGTTPNFAAAIQSIPALASYDPDGLTRLFGSDPRLAPLNVGGYRSSAFDALARRVAVAPDVPARLRATRVELELLARDAPAVPLFFAQGTFAYRPAIYNGWIFVKGTGILDKRSLLPGAAAGRRPQPTPDLSPSPGPDSGSGLDALNVVSLAVLAVVVVLAALALLQRRSDRRRR